MILIELVIKLKRRWNSFVKVNDSIWLLNYLSNFKWTILKFEHCKRMIKIDEIFTLSMKSCRQLTAKKWAIFLKWHAEDVWTEALGLEVGLGLDSINFFSFGKLFRSEIKQLKVKQKSYVVWFEFNWDAIDHWIKVSFSLSNLDHIRPIIVLSKLNNMRRYKKSQSLWENKVNFKKQNPIRCGAIHETRKWQEYKLIIHSSLNRTNPKCKRVGPTDGCTI